MSVIYSTRDTTCDLCIAEGEPRTPLSEKYRLCLRGFLSKLGGLGINVDPRKDWVSSATDNIAERLWREYQ